MREFLILGAGAVALALLAWWCVGERAPVIERDLLERGQASLASSIAANAALSVDGRDATLSGSVPDDQTRRQLLATLREVRGIRTVNDETTVTPLPTSDTEEVASSGDQDSEAAAAAEERRRLQEDLDAIASSDSIQFVTGSAELTPDGVAALDEIVDLLRRQAEVRIEIAGHTDDTGSRATNLELSARRAETVREYLVAASLDRDRFETAGYGPDQPIGDNETPDGRRRNRRVEFRILESDR